MKIHQTKLIFIQKLTDNLWKLFITYLKLYIFFLKLNVQKILNRSVLTDINNYGLAISFFFHIFYRVGILLDLPRKFQVLIGTSLN